MTIAACYLSPEGVVFGSDSTATVGVNSTDKHFLNFGQKIFELGDGSTLGIVTWGLGGFPQTSYRTLFAEFADDLDAAKGKPPVSVQEAAERWAQKFYSEYDRVVGAAYREAVSAAATPQEQAALPAIAANCTVGFCLGGVALPNRRPYAYEIVFRPTATGIPSPIALPSGEAIFRGVPMLIYRVLFGIDPDLLDKIATSPHWTGGDAELLKVAQEFALGPPPMLPLREAIDWIYSCIQSTIKGMKFSRLPPFCGGPVEIAVVTSDRPFRWVRHKSLDVALYDDKTDTHEEAL